MGLFSQRKNLRRATFNPMRSGYGQSHRNNMRQPAAAGMLRRKPCHNRDLRLCAGRFRRPEAQASQRQNQAGHGNPSIP
jgi:hypothetical protein